MKTGITNAPHLRLAEFTLSRPSTFDLAMSYFVPNEEKVRKLTGDENPQPLCWRSCHRVQPL
jgi:hypothetical protein